METSHTGKGHCLWSSHAPKDIGCTQSIKLSRSWHSRFLYKFPKKCRSTAQCDQLNSVPLILKVKFSLWQGFGEAWYSSDPVTNLHVCCRETIFPFWCSEILFPVFQWDFWSQIVIMCRKYLKIRWGGLVATCTAFCKSRNVMYSALHLLQILIKLF